MNQDKEFKFYAGEKVFAFDHTLYKDGVSTPLHVTMKPAIVLLGNYNKETITTSEHGTKTRVDLDLVDLQFKHRGFSKGHHAKTIRKIHKRGFAP